MAYFIAALARESGSWVAHDLDLDAMGDLPELADALRLVVGGDDPVLLVIEREDAWWALVRVDGPEDPRVFVSDLIGMRASAYAELLEVAPDDDDPAPATCGGDLDLLVDLGTSTEQLQEMCDDEWLPTDALTAVAEHAGFAELLDSLR